MEFQYLHQSPEAGGIECAQGDNLPAQVQLGSD